MSKRCDWNKDHGKATVTVRYTAGNWTDGTHRVIAKLCDSCMESLRRNGHANPVVMEDAR